MLPEPTNTIITAIGGFWLLTVIVGFLIFAGRNIFIFTDVRHPFIAAVKTVTTVSSHVATWLALVLVTGYSVTSNYDRYGIWPFLVVLLTALVIALALHLFKMVSERKPLTDPDQLLTSSPDD